MLHSVTVVKDLQATQAFYRDILGMRDLRYRSFPDGSANGFSGVLPETEGFSLELVQQPTGAAGVRVAGGFRHFGIAVADIDAAVARAQELGFEALEGTEPGEVDEVYVVDPSGYRWQLIYSGEEEGEEEASSSAGSDESSSQSSGASSSSDSDSDAEGPRTGPADASQRATGDSSDSSNSSSGEEGERRDKGDRKAPGGVSEKEGGGTSLAQREAEGKASLIDAEALGFEPFREVSLRVADLARSVAYYRDVLGMRVVSQRSGDGFKQAYVCWGDPVSNTQLELTQLTASDALVETAGNGYVQIAAATRDVFATTEQIRAAGGTITREPGPVPGIGTKVMKATDADGWVIAFVDYADFLKELA